MPTKGWKQRRAERLGLVASVRYVQPWHAPRYSAASVPESDPHPEPSQVVADHAADPMALREYRRLTERYADD